MQAQAADDLKRLVTDALVERGLTYEGAAAFATPRRLALHVAGLPARQPDTREERKGPRVGAPEAAVTGFPEERRPRLASTEATIEKDPKKGEFYVAMIERPGRDDARAAGRDPARDHPRLSVAEVDALGRGLGAPRLAALGAPAAFDPRDLRPGDRRARHRAIRDRRHRAGNMTYGHRFMAPARSRCAASTITSPRSRRRRSCSTRAAPRHHPARRPGISPWRRASSSSRTRACWKRSPASSNGPSC